MEQQRILVVDDEPVIHQLIQATLGGQYDLFFMRSGQTLNEILEDLQPNLVILDVRLPAVNGLEICRRIRAVKNFNSIPVIFLSALSGEDDAAHGMSVGGDYYMAKPFETTELRRIVETLICLTGSPAN
ncbi:MAG: response regulator [Elusimicrobiota bacterium]|jgi:DNA-binding response OmpR family regulator